VIALATKSVRNHFSEEASMSSDFAAGLRLRFPPPPPEPSGPTEERTMEVHIDGLTWSTCEDAEPRILNGLREHLVRRLGEARIERRYECGERVGYVTWVRHPADVAWLRCTVAVLAQAACIPRSTLRVR
jgi:hypothetical protein